MTGTRIFLIFLGIILVIGLAAGTTFFILSWQQGEEELADLRGEIVDLGEFMVNVEHQRGLRIVRAEISLEVIGDDPQEVISEYHVQIRDEVIKILRQSGEQAIEDPAAIELKRDLADAINEILGRDLVRSVYFTEFVVQ